ncbi:hypothetical protein PHLGIDRAFT_126617 [Phlebiopsis gigantea 11061_1 CR5-6]|uniref:Glutathione S-transferase C-terminal-like protein n=1 Tax=Phlebiopsis gigantea (strain 11061_1 CR5-6) TaxID=745531 RepID=A0A0C3SA97_PHLG1|nr:hypothetical protein PHLGIDRAFT_126617 [Phlebiopsis gigantea 11061_1 CR5-6]
MSHGKQFTLYSIVFGPNGWKVEMVLRELGLAFETIFLDPGKNEIKAPEFTKYNPNGRIPALIDHLNDDFVVWESNAIIYYLIEKYDTEHKISAETLEDKVIQQQWLYFQASGQGPYFGQCGWFTIVAPPEQRNPVAAERYKKEILRVFGVLDGVLATRKWLMGDKFTVADISFVMWNEIGIKGFVADYNGFNCEKDFPNLYRWHTEMCKMPSVGDTLGMRKSLL